jgi:hypothetical protein
VAGERGSGNAREIEGIRAGEENFRVAKTDSLLTRAMIGEVEGRGPGSGVATCRLEEWGSVATSGCSVDSGTTVTGTRGAGSAQHGAVSVTVKQGQAPAGGDRRRWRMGRPGEKENGPGPRRIVPFPI